MGDQRSGVDESHGTDMKTETAMEHQTIAFPMNHCCKC